MAGFGCHGRRQLSEISARGISLFQYDVGNLEEAGVIRYVRGLPARKKRRARKSQMARKKRSLDLKPACQVPDTLILIYSPPQIHSIFNSKSLSPISTMSSYLLSLIKNSPKFLFFTDKTIKKMNMCNYCWY